MKEKNRLLLVYDGECPACSFYSGIIRIRENIGDLEIVNARDPSPIMDEITKMGLDIDQGMILKMDDQIYYGADAMHMLALISSRSGILNKFNYAVFRSRTLSRVFYPMLRACRNILLRVLGKAKINNLRKPNNNRF